MKYCPKYRIESNRSFEFVSLYDFRKFKLRKCKPKLVVFFSFKIYN